jgi:hypothetical protein
MQSPGAYQWREDNDEFEEDSGSDFFVAGGGRVAITWPCRMTHDMTLEWAKYCWIGLG